MTNMIVFFGGFTATLILAVLLLKYVFCEKLNGQPRNRALAFLMTPHALRHVGLLAIVPEVVGKELAATGVSKMVAYGDGVVCTLALLAIFLQFTNSGVADAMTWVFSVVASLDLLNALYGALTLPVYNYSIGVFWVILTLLVPVLLVTQIAIFARLIRSDRS
jgi:hypothetical protein